MYNLWSVARSSDSLPVDSFVARDEWWCWWGVTRQQSLQSQGRCCINGRHWQRIVSHFYISLASSLSHLSLSLSIMSAGKFVLVQGDDDNFDKIMAAVGKLIQSV